MNKEDQLEEMVMLMTEGARPAIEDAEALYNAGYRKASDLAEEIFAEIEKSIANLKYTVSSPRYTHIPVETMVEVCNWLLQECIPKRIAELKKKYTE